MTAHVIASTKSDSDLGLEHLTIVQASDNKKLPPLDTGTKLTAKIPTTGLLPTDEFQVFLVGGPGSDPRGSYASPLLRVGSLHPRTLNLNKAVVAFLLGNTMTLIYRITHDGTTSPDSELLVLNVLDLPADALGEARIFGKQDDGSGPELDLTTDTEDRTVRIALWPLAAKGQPCWVTLKGKNADSTDYESTVFLGKVDQDWITRGHIDLAVLYSVLEALADGSDLTIEYRVAFDQREDESKAHSSVVRSYAVKNAIVARPEIIEMTDFNGVKLPNGGFTAADGVILKGTAAAHQEVWMSKGGSVFANSEGEWEYKFKKTNLNLTPFAAIASDGKYSAVWIVFFLREGVPIITRVTDSRGEHIPEYGATFESAVTVEGTANPGGKLSISVIGLDESLPLVDVGPDGVWRCTVSGLKIRRHVIFVRHVDDNLNSFGWELHVVEVDSPVITSITDSLNRSIPQFGSTYDQTVKLIGTAKSDRELQFYNKEDFIGERFKADANREWARTLTLDPDHYQDLGVKAFYGKEEKSPSVYLIIHPLLDPNTAMTDFDDAAMAAHLSRMLDERQRCR
ncbi:hypothetical protein [Pseudomonas brassicacearum]|uniref:Uncharacterized protein n=1 Tax=Pseudomonas brassicacearum TaxID=930166 RepID=A0A423GUC3_9PSED|nr:hypothetical protein [Pseudomonas brassicacearum]RON01049.1 hypothetical protein BK658_07750 [Pseudomonas brassicacearum]